MLSFRNWNSPTFLYSGKAKKLKHANNSMRKKLNNKDNYYLKHFTHSPCSPCRRQYNLTFAHF